MRQKVIRSHLDFVFNRYLKS